MLFQVAKTQLCACGKLEQVGACVFLKVVDSESSLSLLVQMDIILYLGRVAAYAYGMLKQDNVCMFLMVTWADGQ
jgi:hypothetical protein